MQWCVQKWTINSIFHLYDLPWLHLAAMVTTHPPEERHEQIRRCVSAGQVPILDAENTWFQVTLNDEVMFYRVAFTAEDCFEYITYV